MLSIYVRVIPTKSYLFCYPEIGPLNVKRKKRRERERESHAYLLCTGSSEERVPINEISRRRKKNKRYERAHFAWGVWNLAAVYGCNVFYSFSLSLSL